MLESLSDNPFRTALVDPTGEKKSLRAGELLGMSMALARQWKKSLPERRVGVILPPGTAGTLANVGLLFAGKVPVNLNPTLSEVAARACLEQAGHQDHPHRRCDRTEMHEISMDSSPSSYRERNRKHFSCATILAPCRGISFADFTACEDDRQHEDRSGSEAILLFTSGSSGLPKGVPLTHRNLVTNILQVSETGFVEKDDRLLTALPLFHSFGLTMGFFFPWSRGEPLYRAFPARLR